MTARSQPYLVIRDKVVPCFMHYLDFCTKFGSKVLLRNGVIVSRQII